MRKNIFFMLIAFALITLLGAGCGEQQADNGSTEQAVSGIDDVCNYFPKELVEQAIGKPIVKVAGPSFTGDKTCTYYTDYKEGYYGGKMAGGGNVVAVIEDKNFADWKAEQEKFGYKLEKDPSIAVEHYAVRSTAKEIWQVTLFINANKYLRIQTNHSAVAGPELVKIAAKFAERINQK